MKQRFIRSLFGILLLLDAVPCFSQYAPPDSMRFTAWNPGLNAVGGIPNRQSIFRTISPSGSDDSDTLQAVVDDCPAGKVVRLAAGEFLINTRVIISKSITLRGAGPGLTTLRKTNGAYPNVDSAADYEPIIIIGPGPWPGPDESTSQDLSANGRKGELSVIVKDATGFAKGQFVLLDELSGASWQPDRLGRGSIWASSDYRVVWQFHNPELGFDDPLIASTPTGGDAAGWFCRQDRPITEIKEIASVSGQTITFTTPIHFEYRTNYKAQLTRYTDNGNGGVHVTYAGVEDLTTAGASSGAIRFECAAYSWAKNVEVTRTLGDAVALNNSFKCEIRDSYIHDAVWAQPGGAGYNISIGGGSSEILFENNVSVRANKVMVARCAGAGSVFGYNYADEGYINTISDWIEIGLNASHMVGPHHVLFEGNYGFNWDSDHTHGNSTYMTVFRNWLRGIRSPFINPLTGQLIDDTKDNGPKRCIGATAYSSWMTFVGNVLGAPGEMQGWSYESTGQGSMGQPAIWLLGWDDVSPQPFDSVTVATEVRDGNWDWVGSKQSWHNSTPVTLQKSLYLADKPSFFGNNPWPWVDPTTGQVGVLPAKERFEKVTSVAGQGGELPAGIQLFQNYPNPFNPSTTVEFSMKNSEFLVLHVFDILGREVAVLVNERLPAGRHSVRFDASKLATGVYMLRLSAGTVVQSKKILLVK
jgi:hypothetical protein